MRKCSSGCGWRLSTGVAAIGALAMSVGAVARPVGASVLTRSSVTETGGSQSRSGVITILSDQEKLRGSVSGVAGVEATVYANVIDTGNWTVTGQRFNYAAQVSAAANSDIAPRTLTVGTFIADDMFPGGGWALGNQISSFSAFVRRSGGDNTRGVGDGTTVATVTLWDGDPMNVNDTTGDGFTAAPIPGATCDFTLDPAFGFGTLQNLKCNLATPITPAHDGVWMVLTSQSCRLFWPITLLKATIGNSRDGAELGQDDDAGEIGSFADPVFVTAATDGNCCAGGDTCGPTGVALFCGGATSNGSGRCSDGDAETHLSFSFGGPCTGDPATDSCVNYLAQINAPADTTISLVPIGGASNVGITGQEISYTAGGGTVSLEVRISSWDPNGAGTLLKAWQAAVDVSGYTSGLQGTLTPSSKKCGTDNPADPTAPDPTKCLPGGSAGADFLGVCSASGNPCSSDGDCAFSGPPLFETCSGLKCDLRFAADPAGSEVCLPGYIQTKRSDYVFNGLLEALAIDLSNPSGGLRWASALNGSPSIAPPSPFPAEGLYVASLQLDISSNAAGTFTMGLLPPSDSVLIDDASIFIPLIGIVPAKITIQTGRCCDRSGTPFVCVSDTGTAGDCAALGFGFDDPGTTCVDVAIDPDGGCKCTANSQCDDGDPCTNEVCDLVPTSATFGKCSNPINYTPATQCCNSTTGVTATTDDGDPCTTDSCDGTGGGAGNGSVAHGNSAMGTPCGSLQGSVCDADDTCDGAGACVDRKQADGTLCGGGLDPVCSVSLCSAGACLAPQDVTGLSCSTNADCVALNNGSASGNPFCDTPNTCVCVACTSIGEVGIPPCVEGVTVDRVVPPVPAAAVKGPAACTATGDAVQYTVNLTGSPGTSNIVGGQFSLSYDPACMQFVSVVPRTASPAWGFVASNPPSPVVDETAGTIFFAAGVDPFGGPVGILSGTMATINFTKLAGCDACGDTCLNDGVNPRDTILTDDIGGVVLVARTTGTVAPDIDCDNSVVSCDGVTITCPGNQTVNADCDFPSAIVNYAATTGTSDCGNVVTVVCEAKNASGAVLGLIGPTGGEFPIGLNTVTCTATSTVGASDTCSFTVDVTDANSLDVTVQLSPVISGNVTRCIDFELFADCVQPPATINKNLAFGSQFDFVGHFTDSIKTPSSGQWVCITARDRFHSLRACDTLVCSGGSYSATFKGDPFFGGNWLVNGNLDGFRTNPGASRDVIDILDFGTFVAQFGTLTSMNTDCTTTVGPNADINGDGMVDATDFGFITLNFLASSKDCCCGAAASLGNTLARTEVSVRELRAMGMADLTVADLNNDGVVNTDDIAAFLSGDRPTRKAPVKGRAGGNVRSR